MTRQRESVFNLLVSLFARGFRDIAGSKHPVIEGVSMFFVKTLYLIAPSYIRMFFSSVKRTVALMGRNRLLVALDLLFCYYRYGATFNEYVNLKFYARTPQNRNTYLTTFYNMKNAFHLNNWRGNRLFIDKVEFNTLFKDFLRRRWVDIGSDKGSVRDFFSTFDRVIVKPRAGDSGKGIFIVETAPLLASDEEFEAFLSKHQQFIAEEIIYNHPQLAMLNPTSLNTLRMITFVTPKTVEFLFAGIRVGRKGSAVDNISKGGRVAVIDLATGYINTGFYAKYTSVEGLREEEPIEVKGMQIPLWEETIAFVSNVARVAEDMRYIAWDIAITPDGPALIEGNHGSGNTVLQAHLGTEEYGLKPRVIEILKEYKNSI